ncbi:GyrI-like domain-containing protein [Micromonospora sp. WMMD987]|uniref:GyrI-like domain-containing protein n=1 Tax=Micromonospora sp. WMMD987 TaxID=3016089 RepID=UPI00249AF648|nr:GyrI-like domain-containing protein [Micromonospora sp. WMMD987]WFE94867.1 GyrI-like domain-containing protein [Micromonospora sp. WMMD987]
MTSQPPVTPVIIERAAQPYVGIRRSVTMRTIGGFFGTLSELIAWVAAQGVIPPGPDFIRYHVIDMAGELEIEAGVPLPAGAEVAVEAPMRIDVLPAGRYLTTTHVGDPDDLVAVTGAFLAWAEQHGMRWDAHDTDAGEHWGCRLEIYHSGPDDDPDRDTWETQLAFRLAD